MAIPTRNINVVISANVRKYTDGLRAASTATKNFQNQVSTGGRVNSRASGSINAMSREHSTLEKMAHASTRAQGMAAAATNRTSAAARNGNRALAAASQATGAWGKSLTFVKTAAIQAVGAFGGFMFMTAVISSVTKGFEFMTKSVMEFDKAMTESMAIMDDQTDAARANLEAIAKDVSKITTFSPTEAAEGLYYLASAGYAAEQSISLLPIAAKFAQAGVMDLEKATEMLSDVQKAVSSDKDPLYDPGDLELTKRGMQRVADVVAKTAVASNATLAQVGEAFTNKFGAQMRLMNKSIEEGGAVIAVYANQGIKGAVAGTQATMAMRDLQTRAIKNAGVFQQFGLEVFDSAGNMKHMGDIIANLEGILGNMNDEQRRATLLQLGFQDRSVQALLALVGFSDEIKNFDSVMHDAGGTTEEVAQRQLKSFSSQIALIRNQLAIFAQEVGVNIIAGIGKVVTLLTPAFNSIKDGVTGIVEAMKPFAAIAGKVLGTAFIASVVAVGKAFEVVGGVLERFQTLFAGLVTALVVKWTVAKLSMTYGATAIGVGFLNLVAHVEKFGFSLTKNNVVIGAYVRMSTMASGASRLFSKAIYEAQFALLRLQAAAQATGAKLATPLVTATLAFKALGMAATTAGQFMRRPMMNTSLALDALRTRLSLLRASLLATGATGGTMGAMMAAAFTAIKTGAAALGITMAGVGMAISGAFTAGLIAIPMYMSMFQDMKASAQEAASAITEDLDMTKYSDLMEASTRLTDEWAEASANAHEEASRNKFVQIGQDLNPFADNTISESMENATAVGEEFLAVQEKIANVKENVGGGMAEKYRKDGEAIEDYQLRISELADTMGVDLTRGFDESSSARAKVEAELARQERAYASVTSQAVQFGGAQVEESKEGADAIEEAAERAGKALKGLYDPEEALNAAKDIAAAINDTINASSVFGDLTSKLEGEAQASAEASAEAFNKGLENQKDAIDDELDAMEKSMKSGNKKMSSREKEAAEERKDIYKDEADARKEALDEQKKSSDDFYNKPTVTAGGFLDALRAQADEMEDYRANMTKIREMGGSDDLILALSEMGEEGIPLIKQLSGQLGGEASAMIDALNVQFARFGDLPEVSYTEFSAQMAKRAGAASEFGNNLNFLASMGLDRTQLMAMVENPEFAGVLQNMADSIRMAPDEETKQREIAAVAQVTADVYAAENIDTSGFKTAMDMAMSASFGIAEVGAQGIVEMLAEQFGKTPDKVREQLQWLQDEYGITIPGLTTPAGELTTRDERNKSILESMLGGQASRQANGGIVEFFKNGGLNESHNAQIAKAGDWRVWAEPETGGEAYIPLGRNKRNQALPVLAEVARRFGATGYANGGYGPSGSAMVGGGNWGTSQSATTVVAVPVESKNITNFNGPIQGVRMEDAEKFAARKRRQQRLAGGRR